MPFIHPLVYSLYAKQNLDNKMVFIDMCAAKKGDNNLMKGISISMILKLKLTLQY